MRYNLFSYLVGEGYQNAIKNKKSTSSCLLSMIGAMILFGIFFAIMINTNSFLKGVEADQGISVYILEGSTQQEIDTLEKKIKDIDGVASVEFKSKEAALDTVKSMLNNEELAKTYEIQNPFPASFVVKFTDLSLSQSVKEKIATLDSVEDIRSADETISKIIMIANGVKRFFIVFSIILVLISIVLINNVIKLSIVARGREISIMKYVGATNSFIRWPFIVEGIIIGLAGAAISIGIMALIYLNLYKVLINNPVISSTTFSLIPFADIFTNLFLVYIFLGIGIGIIGSSTSMRKYLEV